MVNGVTDDPKVMSVGEREATVDVAAAAPVAVVGVAAAIDVKDHTVAHVDPQRQSIWDFVSLAPLKNLWHFQGVPAKLVWSRSAKSFLEDNLVARAAELGYYFLFALFPTLVFVSSMLGLAAKRASLVYVALLHYLSIVIPHSAYQMVMETFNQTTQAATGGKLTFGLVFALWSASVGFGSIQDTANVVYKARETRPYWLAKLQAIGVTVMLSVVVSLMLGVLLATDYAARRLWATGGTHLGADGGGGGCCACWRGSR